MVVTTRRSQITEITILMATDPNVKNPINRNDKMVANPDPSTRLPPRVPPSARQGVTTPRARFTLGGEDTRTTSIHSGETRQGTCDPSLREPRVVIGDDIEFQNVRDALGQMK
uniref:Uncharacterized protein n=1 Tax=Cannabis sativa TaxID=3483 RepID=A0A803QCL2_CANSA